MIDNMITKSEWMFFLRSYNEKEAT
jgi:hypothetical protein